MWQSDLQPVIMVIDDDSEASDMVTDILSQENYLVHVFPEGKTALIAAAKQPPDLILLDLLMPEMDGFEVCRRLKSDPASQPIPVIFLTASSETEHLVSGFAAGAVDYVTKPFNAAELLARVRTHLELKHAREQLKSRMEQVRKLAGDLEKRNQFIRQVFGRYVTDAVVQSLLETPEGLKLGGEKREVTILMSDLRGFTPIAERLPPEQTVEMLNVYLGEMTTVISRFEGVIDEFIGDAILAIFGAPIRKEDHAQRAVACALAMQLAMARVNEQLPQLRATPLAMGIGINTGPLVVGNIGSAQRAKFGVVGTPVNVVARIQAAAAGGEILVAEATVARIGPILSFREKRTVMAKGLKEPLTLYVVEGIGGEYGAQPPSHGRATGVE